MRSDRLLNVQLDGKRAIIDVRELIKHGGHPRFAIFDYVREAPVNTVVEVHVPRYAKPLIKGLEVMGLIVDVKEIDSGHFKVITEKTKEIQK